MNATAHATQHLRIHRFSALAPGPRLIVTGAVHGNETAGPRGIERALAGIERGEVAIVRGTVTFVPVANPLAYARGERFGERNLNRRLLPNPSPQDNEDRIANVLCPLLAEHDVLLDLHGFRSPGRPFVLRGPADNDGTLEPFAHAEAEARLCAHLGVASRRRRLDGRLRGRRGAAPPAQPHARRGERGPGLRDRHDRVHALGRRLRGHARMRSARRSGRPRGRAPRRSGRRSRCWALPSCRSRPRRGRSSA